MRAVVERKGADRQIDRKNGAIFPLRGKFAAGSTNDFCLAARKIAREIIIVFPTIRFGHEHLDVLPDDFVGAVAEHPFAGWIEAFYDAFCIYRDQAVERMIDNSAQVTLAFI